MQKQQAVHRANFPSCHSGTTVEMALQAYILKCCQSPVVTGCFGYAGNALRSGRMSLRLHHWNAHGDHTHAARSARAKKPAYAMKPHEVSDTCHQFCNYCRESEGIQCRLCGGDLSHISGKYEYAYEYASCSPKTL